MKKPIYEITSLKEYNSLNSKRFKDHVAKYIKLPDGNDCIIEFMKPDQREHWMRFIYIDGVLNINGDYGYAVFNWYNRNNHILAYPTFKDIGYIMSKCVSVKNEDKVIFDEDLFKKEFKTFIADRKAEGYISEEDTFITPYVECIEDVVSHFKESGDLYGDDLYGDDLWETGAFKLGQCLAERPYIWWQGLCEALKQLESRGEIN